MFLENLLMSYTLHFALWFPCLNWYDENLVVILRRKVRWWLFQGFTILEEPSLIKGLHIFILTYFLNLYENLIKYRNITLVRECACCHTKTMVTYSTSKIWLTTLRQTFYLTSIQINFMKRDKNSQIFCIANKFKSLPLARFATS